LCVYQTEKEEESEEDEEESDECEDKQIASVDTTTPSKDINGSNKTSDINRVCS